jgi:uncharacterized protein involved in exopolysaccharide biosynthesis
MEQSFDLGMITSVIKRRYMYFLLPAIVVFSIAVLVAFKLPRVYEAKAIILIESQRIPSELASSTVTASPSERIKVIEQRLLARDNLLGIAEKFSLYQVDGKPPSPTEIVEEMRDAIAINQINVSRSRRNTEIIGFDVSFEYETATMASRVANELVNSILSQNLETRLSRATETSDFFQQQLRNLDVDLATIEERIATFKRENEAALPETLVDRRLELSEVNTQIGQIEQEIQIISQTGTNAGTLDGAKAQQLAFRLQSEELNYNSFVERRELLGPLAEKGYVSKKTMSDLDRQIAQTEIQITAIKSEMSQNGIVAEPEVRLDLLKARKDELEKRAEDISQSISLTPTIEVKLAAMTRDYENLRAEYSQTKAKLTDAQIGKRLEEDRQAERFEVLEQATVPEEPASPNRLQIILAGGAGAMASGIGLVILLELLDGSVRTARDLERRLQIRPIAVIPYVTTRRERWAKILKRLLLACAALLSVAFVLAAIHQFYLPLDLLAERGMRTIQPLIRFVSP